MSKPPDKKLPIPVDHTVETLVKDALEGQRSAQQALYDRFCGMAYSVALRMTGREDWAMDAVQNAFVQVFQGLDGLREATKLGGWIKTVVVRNAVHVVNRERKLVLETQDIPPEPVVWPQPMTGVELDAAIRQLSDGYRLVFTLIEVEGYTHKEVAKQLNISVGTSKSQLYHAKRQLQKLLDRP